MKIDIYAIGACKNNGRPTQIAGCGIVLESVDEHGRRSFRHANYGLGNSTQNLADLQAARLALASIRAAHRSAQATLYTTKYVSKMLEHDGSEFVSKPSSNKEAIAELRRWFLYYDNIEVVVNPNNDQMQHAKDQASIAMNSQEHSDSGTIQSD